LFDLVLFGIITGFISGFFGVGGGMVLIPMLLFADYSMKQAVSISIIQMLFSSIYGSFLNSKQNKEIIKDGFLLGIGGFIGGLQSGLIHSVVSNEFLQYLFITIIFISILSLLNLKILEVNSQIKYQKSSWLILVGICIGAIAMSIGVGGSVMIIPLLSVLLHYDLKTASSLGLFFVIFSSIAGFVSLSFTGEMLYTQGIIVGIASLVGVYLGVKIKNKVQISSYKKYILILYILILILMVVKMY
jgi:uncharacterized membrane protein YfcA